MTHRSPSRFFAAICFGLCLVCSLSEAQDRVSRKAPAIYSEISPILLPLKTAVEQKATDEREVDPEHIESQTWREILRETVYYIDAEMRPWRAEHVIRQVLSETGIEPAKEATYSYSRSLVKPHVVLARTVQADGREVAAFDKGIFVQTPQYLAQQALYDDQGELRIIYPQVEKGSITESIVLFEEVESLSEEVGHTVRFWGNFSENRRRFVVDVPEVLADQVRLSEKQISAQKGSLGQIPEGRRRWVWDRENLSFPEQEASGPAILSLVPQVRFSTFRTWDSVASWYTGLLAGEVSRQPPHQEASDLLATIPEDASREETVNRLLDFVANDIRYTGLEFGISAFKPNSPKEVLDAGYGDCKDKSNLLRVLLEKRGIPAYMTLVRSRSFGRIEKDAPHFGAFDHCILAVETEDGELAFCDPTFTNARLGVLPNGDAGRELFVISEAGGRWVSTAIPDSSTNRLSFAYTLESDQSLSGKMNYEGRGADVLASIRTFQTGNKVEQRIVAGRYASSLFYNTYAPEVSVTQADADNQTLAFHAYVVRSGQRQAQAYLTDRQIDFNVPGLPSFAPWVPTSGEKDSERRTSYRQIGRKDAVQGTIKLPDGYQPEHVPSPYSVNSDWLYASAFWIYDEPTNRLSLELKMISRAGDIPPEEFASFAASARELRKWLSGSLVLKPSAGGSFTVAPKQSLSHFKVLSDGDSQLAYVDYRYPSDGDVEQRRMALVRTSELFPSDRLTQFRCEVQLALIDLDGGEPQAVIDRLQHLLAEEAGRIPVEHYAEGEGYFASALAHLGRHDEAVALFKKVASNPLLNRGGREYYILNLGISSRSCGQPELAIDLLEEGIEWRDSRWRGLYAEWALALCEVGETEKIESDLTTRVGRDRAEAELLCELLLAYAEQSETPLTETGKQNFQELFASLSNVEELSDSLGKLMRNRELGRDQNAAAKELIAKLKLEIPETYQFYHAPALVGDDLAATRQKVAELESQGLALEAAQAALAVITYFPVNDESRNDLLQAAIMVNWALDEGSDKQGEPLIADLLAFLRNEPKDSVGWFHAYFQGAFVAKRAGDWQGMREAAGIALDGHEVGTIGTWHNDFNYLIAQSYLGEKDYPKAIEAYRAVTSDEWSHKTILSYMEGIMVACQVQAIDDAVEFADRLRSAPEAIKQVDEFSLVLDLVSLPEDTLRTYWDTMDRVWWPEWSKFANRLDAGIDTSPERALISLEEAYQAADQMLPRDDQQKVANIAMVADLARWNPGYIPLLYPGVMNLNQSGIPVLHRSAYRDLVVGLAQDIPVSDHPIRVTGMVMASFFLAQDRYGSNRIERLAKMKKVLDQLDAESDLQAAEMQFLRPMAALAKLQVGEQDDSYLDKAITNVLSVLEDLPLFQGRPALVGQTLFLMRNRSRYHGKIGAFAERELEVESNQSNKMMVELLQEAKEDFGDYSEGDGYQYADFIQQWLDQHQPQWWDYAKPQSTEQAQAMLKQHLDRKEIKRTDWLGGNLVPRTKSNAYDGWIGESTHKAQLSRASRFKAVVLCSLAEGMSTQDVRDAYNAAVKGYLSLVAPLQHEEQAKGIEALAKLADSPYIIGDTKKTVSQLMELHSDKPSEEPAAKPVDKKSSAALSETMARLKDRKTEMPVPAEFHKQLEVTLADGVFDFEELRPVIEFKKGLVSEHLEILQDFLTRAKDTEPPHHIGKSTRDMFLNHYHKQVTHDLQAYETYRSQILEVFPEPIAVSEDIGLLTGSDKAIASRMKQIAEAVEELRAGEMPTNGYTFSSLTRLLRQSGKPEYVELAVRSWLTIVGSRFAEDIHTEIALDFDIPIHRQVYREWLKSQPEDDSHSLFRISTPKQRRDNLLRLKSGDSFDVELIKDPIDRLRCLLGGRQRSELTAQLAKCDISEIDDLGLEVVYQSYRYLAMESEMQEVLAAMDERLPELITRVWSGERRGPNLLVLCRYLAALGRSADSLPAELVASLPDVNTSEYTWTSESQTFAVTEWFSLVGNWEMVVYLALEGHRARPTTVDWMEHLVFGYDRLGEWEKSAHFANQYLEYGRGNARYGEIADIAKKHE